ncbi:DUF4012 domain-containing protein [Demequina maris]|uniref:DUF4012 domain-containing protein n=1 Tax=Demequina maris TaxID=1638982 RepID=UPI0007824B56|nr:DUF4012 domain-containing protein [Demequina maris]
MSETTPAPLEGGRARHGARPRRRVWPWVVGGVGVVIVAVGVVGFLFAKDASTMLRSADALTSHAKAAKDAVADRDAPALAAEVDGLEASAREFADATSGWHWQLAAHTPWVADQARPLMAAGGAVDAMASEALAPLASMDSLDALAVPGFEDGRIDPYVLEPYRAPLAQASSVLETQASALADVSLANTLDQVAKPFLDLQSQLDELAGLVGAAHVAAELLPTMLGGEGERTYLVMVQNNAEPRATGGIPSAIIELTVDSGRIEMGEYRTAKDLKAPNGIGGLTADEERIFGDQMEIFPQDVNFTPEFPRSAELMTRFWAAGGGDDVDGVVSVDPVALGWMLEGADPVQVGPFEISGDNLAQVMLNETYIEFPEGDAQDAYFARAATVLFGSIVSGEAAVLDGVERAIDAHRFMVWSADESEQAMLVTTQISGGFLERENAVGVFVNDGSGDKIGYYVDSEATITDLMCPDGSIAGQEVEVAFTHTLDRPLRELPEAIIGGVYVPEGEFHANVVFYPARGTGVAKVTLDGKKTKVRPENESGRSMATARIELKPGETATLGYEITATESGVLPPLYVQTPGALEPGVARVERTASEGC